jgi:hypothetical protein
VVVLASLEPSADFDLLFGAAKQDLKIVDIRHPMPVHPWLAAEDVLHGGAKTARP